MSKVIEITKDNLNEVIDNNQLVFVDFWEHQADRAVVA